MPTAEELKAEGNKAFACQEFKKAAKIYRDAIKLDPTNPVLYSNRAQCFIKENDWTRAMRDCNDGLALNPNVRTKIKLIYRKGIVHKGLGEVLNAEECFNQVLNQDPSNTAATNELKLIKNINKDSYSNLPQSIEIPICEVDSLPQEFRMLTNISNKRPDDLLPTKPTTQLDNEINELFGNKDSVKKVKRAESKSDSETFGERPTMKILSMLNTLPENQKVGAYKYITTLTPGYYNDLFGSTGIDSEFLRFFMEAAAYISSHKIIEKWEVRIYDLLKAFSALHRYELSLLFCSKAHIDEIIDNVNKINDVVISKNYQKLLNH